ncbi:hypothetical protein BGZ70_000543 [Mortierella alpina]|uniref:ADP-ribosylglycohydrolase n=1 Tax=Mortierella alpina TaxID=64518 RepID=A0A9P6IXQ2_MORAP|nr:hypothetical protein BGZ70_000543 [Mortierella alpina]
MSKKTATRVYGNGPIAFGRDPGYPVWEDHHRLETDRNDFTDDTDQMLVILQSLEQTCDGHLHPTNFAHKLLEWESNGIPEIGTDPGRGLGFTVGSVLGHPFFLHDPHTAAFKVWDDSGRDLAPNGAVMRTAVLGIECFWDEPRVVENAIAAAKTTHADPRSVVSALVSSVFISRFLRGGGQSAADDKTRVWNTELNRAQYRQGLLAYLRRGMNDYSTLTDDVQAATFTPKDYEALERSRLEKESKIQSVFKEQSRNRSPTTWNANRPEVSLRPNIGWAGIDHVGEDEAAGWLARSVIADYKFLLQETDVVPLDGDPRYFHEEWTKELENHCFPQSLAQLELGGASGIGYTFKCIGAAYYGATRKVDPAPTAPEYDGPAGLFRGLMEQITLEAGDADTNAAVMGSLLGARFGLDQGIPSSWWTELQHLEWLDATVNQYAERVIANYENQLQ